MNKSINHNLHKNNANDFFFIFFLLLSSRIIIYYYFNLQPDKSQLEYGWHLIKPFFLKNYFLESIIYLHFQPPLWNFLVGILFQIFETKDSVNTILHIFNIFLTLFTAIFALKICKIYSLNKSQIFFILLLIILNKANMNLNVF